ncbi:uncharacterized protein LOC131160834 [Malania oleifera]|uniref:uncharacterized protein LOC131160834 n=1 Tax=Malania oleifera TaxID=397392 RepID=UPI0025AE9F2F|nr:uncharacterized protein LOC131160834 [Malania oleifera]
MMWSRFREIFFEQYIPATVRSVKASEFLHLTQGSMTVQQYTTRFVELFRFAPYMVPNEERKARKFEEGLIQKLYEQVIGFQALTFLEIVERATVIESSIKRGTDAQSQRKRPAPSDFQAESSQGPWRRYDSRGG